MTRSALEHRLGAELREDLRRVAMSSGCDILEADFKGDKLYVILDHPEGVTLTHCEQVSKKVSALLDVSDFGDAGYVLEVSSPGLDRKLYGADDFRRFSGRLARVTWRDPERGKRTDVGRLEALEGAAAGSPGTIRLSRETGDPLQIALADISEARLEIEI